MKIVQVCPRYFPDVGGVETHVREISERLVKRGFEVEVVCTADKKYPARDEINGVTVRRFNAIAPTNAYYFSPRIYSYLKRTDCDIIHAHNYHAFPALFAALAKGERRLIFTPHYHGISESPLRNFLLDAYKPLGSLIFKRSDVVICVSKYERELVRKDFQRNAVIIPNGINLKKMEGIRPFKFSGKLIFYVGRLEKYKKIHLIIQSMKYLDDFYFYIAGKGSFETELKKIVRNLELEDKVKFLGFIDEKTKFRWLRTCSVFVNLSPIEAFGITVLEALACGKPAVVSNKSALVEFADKFDCIFAVNDNAPPKELAEVIKKAVNIEINADLREYGWDEIIKKILDVYMFALDSL